MNRSSPSRKIDEPSNTSTATSANEMNTSTLSCQPFSNDSRWPSRSATSLMKPIRFFAVLTAEIKLREHPRARYPRFEQAFARRDTQ